LRSDVVQFAINTFGSELQRTSKESSNNKKFMQLPFWETPSTEGHFKSGGA
jgi:hypothetical protein